MFLVVNGSVEASIAGKHIVTLGSESILGDVAILDGMPYAVTTTATDEVVAIKIEREKFEDILDANPGAARGVIRVLTRKLRYFGQQVIEAHKGKPIQAPDMDMPELKL